jgi:hypothetical protein
MKEFLDDKKRAFNVSRMPTAAGVDVNYYFLETEI